MGSTRLSYLLFPFDLVLPLGAPCLLVERLIRLQVGVGPPPLFLKPAAISARSCASFQFFTVQDLIRGECDVWSFYKHDLAFVPFSFFHPLHVGEQSVEYPQGVISIQRTKQVGSLQFL